MKKVGILYHPMIDATHKWAGELKEFLSARGFTPWSCSSWEMDEAKSMLDNTDLLISIGGDGTILRTAQISLPNQIPITGINLGKLGFMTELSTDEVMDKLPELLAGKGWIDERAILEAIVSPPEGEQKPQGIFYALNDVVMARGSTVRVVYIDTTIDNQHMATYKADGIIVATATGSTGYSLAAGGPILYPQSEELLLLPIIPHLSPAYPIVLPSTSVVYLKINTTHQATLCIDGHINLDIPSGTSVALKISSNKIRFLRIHPKNSFYSTLAEKLKGKR